MKTAIVVVVLALAIFGGLYFMPSDDSPALSNEDVVQTPSPIPPVTAEKDMDLVYPNGGEIFDLNQSVTIRYAIGKNLKQKISSDDKSEIYLLDSNNNLFGYIAELDVASTQFIWNPQRLEHSHGLDITIEPTPPGQYRILIIVRPKAKIDDCLGCDNPVDLLDSERVRYEGDKIISYSTDPYNGNLTDFSSGVLRAQVIASDVSASLFTVK